MKSSTVDGVDLESQNDVARERAAESVYLRFGPALARYADRLGAPDPEGVANLAVYDAVRNLSATALRQEKIVKSYVYRAAHGHTVDDLRRLKPDFPVNPANIELPAVANGTDLDTSIRLDEALHQLPHRQATVIVGRFLHEKSVEELAVELGINPNAVYQLQHRALRRLRILLAAALAAVLLVGGIRLITSATQDRFTSFAPTEQPAIDDLRKQNSGRLLWSNPLGCRTLTNSGLESFSLPCHLLFGTIPGTSTFVPGRASTPGQQLQVTGQSTTSTTTDTQQRSGSDDAAGPSVSTTSQPSAQTDTTAAEPNGRSQTTAESLDQAQTSTSASQTQSPDQQADDETPVLPQVNGEAPGTTSVPELPGTTTTLPGLPGTNLLTNGSFESVILPDGMLFDVAQEGWTSSREGNVIETLESTYLQIGATDGRHFIELNGDAANTISQSVPVVPGARYQLSFDHRHRGTAPTNTVSVAMNGGNPQTFVVQSGGWLNHRNEYAVQAGETTLTITLSAMDVGSVGNLIDSVRLVRIG